MRKKIAIIGGGASGIFCAILLAKEGADVTVFEQNNKLAKKILVSGNGRCNITNKHLSTHDYFSENPSFTSYALTEFDFFSFEKFVNSMGLVLNVLDDGRAYPLSNEAKSVAKIFEDFAHTVGVKFVLEEKVTQAKELLKKYDALVIATGSQAASHLGGCSDGYTFGQEFGHNIIPTYPSLVQLHLTSKLANKMSGTKIDAEVTLFINGLKETKTQGDLLFTNYGVSGFAILDISHAASHALKEQSAVDISVNLLPNFNAQKLSNHILNLAKHRPQLTILDVLVGLLPLKISTVLLDDLNYSHATKIKDINIKETKKIANKILNWSFEVSDTHGFRHAEVSGGGIDTTEINPKTFESLKQKNLYFIGEVLDVVGRRGGYNFAFAWSSAFLCAKDIIKT